MTQPNYTINWDEIAQEIQEEFADYSNHEARLVESYLMTMELN